MTIPKAYADCQPIYGGGTACQPTSIVVSKTVLDPKTNTYVHDLGIADPQFHPGDNITFQIAVTNTGSENVGPVKVADVFPSAITFVQGNGGVGTFDSATNTFSFFFPTIMAGETQSLIISAQIVAANQLPASQDTQCMINQVVASTDNGTRTQDSAQFCVFHPVTATPTAPSAPPATGPEMLPLLGLLGSGALGIAVIKYSRKERIVV